jgi:hypothetical protein
MISKPMKLSDINKRCNRSPFRSFQLHLTNGETLLVQHPEQMSLPSDEQEMFVVWTENDWNLVEATQVARISVPRKSPK